MSGPFDGQKVVAFDTETRGFNWWDPAQQAFLGQWADESGEWHAVLPSDPGPLVAALEVADVIVAHNLSFDTHQLREICGLDLLSLGKELHDTDLLMRILRPELARKLSDDEKALGFGLKKLAKAFVDPNAMHWEDIIKERAKQIGLSSLDGPSAPSDSYYQVWRAYPEDMEQYGRMDARYTHDLLLKFYPELLKDARRLALYQLEMAVAPRLIRAEQTGIATDQVEVAKQHKEYVAKERELHENLAKELGEQALGGEGSEDALIEALLKQGVPLYRKTKSGDALSTNKFALEEFEDKYPVLADLMEWRRVKRFLDTYLGPAVGNPVVHTSFFQCEAWTGRMSSRRPNMQNIPKRAGKEVRKIFVPREGNAFVRADFDSIEVRLLAYYLGTAGEPYRQLIEDGHDPHAWMAAQIWGGEMQDYMKETAGEPKRDIAKNVMFAITYGAGVPRVMDMTKLPRDESKALISKIKGSLPGYYKLTNDRIRPKVETTGFVTTMFGRKQIINRDKAYVGLNAIIQGTAADIFKQAVVNAYDALEPIGWQPILFVHDEILSEGPLDSAADAEQRLRSAMVSAADFRPKLAVSSSIVTTNYADA